MKSDKNPDIPGDLASDNPSSSDVPDEDDEFEYKSLGCLSRSGETGRRQSKKAYLSNKFKDLSLQNVQVIEEAMRRRVELLKERNALEYFSF